MNVAPPAEPATPKPAASDSAEAPPELTASAAPSSTAPAAPAATELDRLPAISEDGTRVAILATYNDGGRGNASTELLVLTAGTSQVVRRAVIDDPNDETPARAQHRAAGIEKARATLLAAAPRWIPLVALAMEPDANQQARVQGVGMSTPQLGRSGDLSVTFAEPVLRVERAGKAVHVRSYPEWSDKPSRGCPQCIPCPGALSDLDAAFVDPARRVLVLVLRLSGGTDICWEGGPTYHSVRY